MTPAQRRQQGLEFGICFLILRAVDFGIHRIPPTTFVAIVGQALLYMGILKVPWNAEEVCISSKKVLENLDWRSFIFSNFEHGSSIHLYYNMVSFLLKGHYLEGMYGTGNFAFLLGIFSLGCSTMYVALGYFLTNLTSDYYYYNSCAIGFSAVLFALKVITIEEGHDEFHYIGGFRIPREFAVWAELLLIHALVPNASFIGHLGGILIGRLYCFTFLGEIIDQKLCDLTGRRVIHERKFHRRKNERSFSRY